MDAKNEDAVTPDEDNKTDRKQGSESFLNVLVNTINDSRILNFMQEIAMPYIERRIQSGPLLEIERYFSTRYGSSLPRGGNESQTTDAQERINEKRSMKQLQRLILANFSTENGDLFVTFTYGMPVTEEQARRGERNLIDRLKRLRKRKGLPELKYITVTERQSNWHHHLIINGGLTLEDIKGVWGDRGARTHVSLLDDGSVCEGLARYLTEQHKPKRGAEGEEAEENKKQPREKGQRRWHASRNLVRPQPEVKVLKRIPRLQEPKAPKGFALLKDSLTMGYDVFEYPWMYAAFRQIEPIKPKRQPRSVKKKDGGISKTGAKRTAEGVRGRSPGGLEGRALRAQAGERKPEGRTQGG